VSPLAPTVTLPSGLVVLTPKGAYRLSDLCPDRAEHDPKPDDFDSNRQPVSKTHAQRKHKTCGLWTQWVPRKPTSPERSA
jgi:hypothetical protein